MINENNYFKTRQTFIYILPPIKNESSTSLLYFIYTETTSIYQPSVDKLVLSEGKMT